MVWTGRRLTAALSVALGVLIVAGAGGAYLAGQVHGDHVASGAPPTSTSSSSTPAGTTSSLVSGSNPPSSTGPSATTGATGPTRPTDGASTTPPSVSSASSPPPVTGPPPSISSAPSTASAPPPSTVQPVSVYISPQAAGSPYAGQVQDLLVRYFTAINTKNYQLWTTTVGADRVKAETEALWQADYKSTKDTSIGVLAISAGPPVVVNIVFQSNQAASAAPTQLPGATCVLWDVQYRLTQANGKLLVDTNQVPPSPKAC